MGERVVDAQRGAGRRADEVDPRDGEMLEHRLQIIELRERCFRRIGAAVSTPVVTDHGVLGGQERGDVVPQRRVHDAVVHEEHRLALALALGPEPAAGHFDEDLLRRLARRHDGSLPGRAEEVEDEAVDLGGSFHPCHVGDSREHHPLRAGHAALHEAADEVDVLAVQFALDDERRRSHFGQAPDRRRLELSAPGLAERVGQRHLSQGNPHLPVDLRRGAVRSCHPRAHEVVCGPAGVSGASRGGLCGGGLAPIPAGEREPGHAGADQDEPIDHLRMGNGEVDGDAGAKGVPDERGVLDPQVAQERAEVLVVSPRPIRRGRLAVAGHVEGDDPVAARERVHLRLPGTVIEHPAMDEDHCVPPAGHLVEDRAPFHRCAPLRRRAREDRSSDENGQSDGGQKGVPHRRLLCCSCLRRRAAAVSGRGNSPRKGGPLKGDGNRTGCSRTRRATSPVSDRSSVPGVRGTGRRAR